MPWVRDAAARTNSQRIGLRNVEGRHYSGYDDTGKKWSHFFPVGIQIKPFWFVARIPCLKRSILFLRQGNIGIQDQRARHGAASLVAFAAQKSIIQGVIYALNCWYEKSHEDYWSVALDRGRPSHGRSWHPLSPAGQPGALGLTLQLIASGDNRQSLRGGSI